MSFGVILDTFWSDFGYLLESFWGLGLLLGAKGAPEGPGADFSSILASILVSLGGLWRALGVLWEASGSLWAPKWRPGATKEGTKDLQERFCGHLKNNCFTNEKHGFSKSGSPKQLKKLP